MHRAVVGVVGSRPCGELLQVLLSQCDGSGLVAQAEHMGVLLRDVVGQHLGADGCPDSGRGDVVLNPYGYAVKRSTVLAAHHLLLAVLGLGYRLLVEHGDEGVQDGLKPVRLRQDGLGYFHRGDLP